MTRIEHMAAMPPQYPEIPSPHAWYGRIFPSKDAMSHAVDHISNVEYVRWLDMAGQQHLAGLGWSAQDLLQQGAMWFVARHEIDYRLEASTDDDLMLATWVRDVRRVKSWRDTIVWRMAGTHIEVVCTASTLWVHVNLTTRRPIRPPSEMIDALQPLGTTDSPWRNRA